MSVNSSSPVVSALAEASAEPADGGSPFDSFFMAGFDASSHRRRDGRRLDLLHSTGHDALALQDYRRCVELGIRTVRDGLRWHLIESERGRYDWSSWRPMLAAAQTAGVQVIWDLFHYGHPDFLRIGTEEFRTAFSEFTAEAARIHRQETGQPGFYCPFNEISFFAWAVDADYFPPTGKLRRDPLKKELVRIALAGVGGVRSIEPAARFVWAEPLIHVAPRNHGKSERARANAYRLAQYQAYDMIMGRSAPELGGSPDCVDVVGLNFYPHNQWYYHGPTIPMGHHEYRALADMLVEVQARYEKPMIFAETGAEGSGRPAWLHYVCDEIRDASARGARIEGVCLYPVTVYNGWDNDRRCDVGLFSEPDAAGHRQLNEPLLAEIDRQRALFTPAQMQRKRA
jgi:hypothetical protein